MIFKREALISHQRLDPDMSKKVRKQGLGSSSSALCFIYRSEM